MKKVNASFYNQGWFRFGLLALFCLIVVVSTYFYFFAKQDNDNIFVLDKNDILFRNENPHFTVDFVEDVQGSYIRFESRGSNSSPFEEKSLTFGEKLEDTLGLTGVKKGLKLSLMGFSSDETVRGKIPDSTSENTAGVQKNGSYTFELIESGHGLGESDQESMPKNTVVYKDISEGINIEYQIISGKGLKEEIVLNELPQYSTDCRGEDCMLPANVFYFNLDVDEGLVLNRNIEDGTYFFTDSNGMYYAHFLPEYAKDALGNKTTNVDVLIGETDVKNRYLITVKLDSEWLLSTERVFPIRIDPSIVHDTESVFNMGSYEGTALVNMYSQIGLKELSTNGDYTSGIIDLGENPIVKNLSLNSYGSGTGGGEIPFSTAGMLAQWDFNEKDGVIVNDMSECTNACNLTLRGFLNTTGPDIQKASGWTNIYSKWGGGALMFDGIDDFVSGTVSGLSVKNIYSVETWVLPVSDGYVFNINGNSLLIEDGLWKLSNGQDIYDSGLKAKQYQWQHVVVMFDKDNARASLYIDSDSYIFDNYPILFSSDSIYIGGVQSKKFFKGVIDTTRVYSRGLTESEIYSNAQSGYVGAQFRTSSNGLDWKEWSNSKEVTLDTNEIVTKMSKDVSSLSIPFGLVSAGNTKLLSFLIAGDEKASSINVKYEDRAVETFDSSKPIIYSSAWVMPSVESKSCMLGSNLFFNDNGDLLLNSKVLNLQLQKDNWNLLSFSLEGDVLSVFVNGFLSDSLNLSRGFVFDSNMFNISGCTVTDGGSFVKDIVFSNSNKSAGEIRSQYERQIYSQDININFRADLQSSNLIANVSDREFSISETAYGSTNIIENLNAGDTVIVKEIVGDTEYVAEGEVETVNAVIGKVTVKEWIPSSTFPEQGFSVGSKVLKWQRVYIEAGMNIEALRGALGGLYFVKEGDSKAEYMFKGFSLIEPYGVNGDWDSSNQIDRFFQYRIVFQSIDSNINPYITEINIDYDTLGPTMDRIMRHGKWFDSGTKQSYWWAN